MTNLEYYNWKNLEFKSYALDDDYVVVRCKYLTKHSREDIVLISFVVENDKDKINARKIKWLLEEIDPETITRSVDNMEDYKHIKHKKKQFCFEG